MRQQSPADLATERLRYAFQTTHACEVTPAVAVVTLDPSCGGFGSCPVAIGQYTMCDVVLMVCDELLHLPG